MAPWPSTLLKERLVIWKELREDVADWFAALAWRIGPEDFPGLEGVLEYPGRLDFLTAASIGFHVKNTADRVRIANKHTPGCEARWVIELEDEKYDISITPCK